jgi:hypothetical protein
MREIDRLAETAPVHARGMAKLFVAQLDDRFDPVAPARITR